MRQIIALLLLLSASPALARDRFWTPAGQMELRNSELRREIPPWMKADWMQAIRMVNETSGSLCWIGFALEHGDTLAWPANLRVQLVMKDSTVVSDSLLFVFDGGITMRPYPIRGRKLRSADLSRRPCPWKGTCSNVIAAFPWGALPIRFGLLDVADVRVGYVTPHRTSGGHP